MKYQEKWIRQDVSNLMVYKQICLCLENVLNQGGVAVHNLELFGRLVSTSVSLHTVEMGW
jgi:hypothetical protein